MSVIPAFGRLKQDDYEASLSYVVRSCLKKKKKKERKKESSLLI
jgi:hypothetical protein